jgi:hypothetical protein
MIRKAPIIVAITIAALSVSGMAIAVIHQLLTESVQPAPAGEITYPFEKCYPSTVERPMDVKQSRIDGVTWWEVKARSVRFKNSFSLLHFRTEDRRCKWSNRNRPTFRLDYMPKSRAVDFAMQHYMPMLEACKKLNKKQKDVDKFCIIDMQKGLKDSILFPEEVEALTSMKIDIKTIQGHQVISKSEDIK